MKVIFTFGRFNPPTKGHHAIFSLMEKSSLPGVVFIIDHPKSAKDTMRNPLTGEERKAILQGRYALRFEVVESLGEALDVLDVLGMEGEILVCGEDRGPGYEHLAERLIVLPRGDISATQVREAVVEDRYGDFVNLVLDPSCWDTVRSRLWGTF